MKKNVLELGSKYGFQELEVYQEKSKSLELRVFNQEIDHYGLEESQGLSFRGFKGNKLGYAYSEKLEEDSLEEVVKAAAQNAAINDLAEGEIFAGSDKYQTVQTFNPELASVSVEDKVQFIKEVERKALAEDERVKAVNYCFYGENEGSVELFNSKGLDLNARYNLAYAYLAVVAQEGEDIRSGSHFALTQDFSSLDPAAIASKAVEEAISLLGATSLPSGNYPVILRNDVAADLLATFSSTFSAENVQKGLSLFKDRLGQKVASEGLTLIDDPFLAGGARTAAFDAEGVATKVKKVIEQGTLATYLHNLKTAKKDGVASTGNAFRGSYKDFVGIAPSNMYIQPGQLSYQELIKELDEGIIIINLQGLHSGANPVSGDFSLGAYGYYVKQGKIERPVDQITIAGNFLDLLQSITAIANDLKMGLPNGGHFGSPSLLVSQVAVAGE